MSRKFIIFKCEKKEYTIGSVEFDYPRYISIPIDIISEIEEVPENKTVRIMTTQCGKYIREYIVVEPFDEILKKATI